MDKASDFESEDCEFESRRGRRLFAVAWPRNFGRRFLNSDPYSHGNVKVSTSFRSTNIRYLCKYFFLLPEMKNKMQSIYIFTSFVYLIAIWHYIGSDQPHSFRCRNIRRKLNARSWKKDFHWNRHAESDFVFWFWKKDTFCTKFTGTAAIK